MLKAVVFDMDGVLVDTVEWHYEALNRALKPFGYPISRRDHRRLYNGLPTRVKLEMLSSRKGLPQSLHARILRKKQEYTLALIDQRCAPDPVKLDLLRQLKEEGYRLAVCSNAVPRTVERLLLRSGMRPWIELSLSNKDIKQPKPHPEIYLKACRKLGLPSSRCLAVEDTVFGEQAARGAGLRVLRVKCCEEVTYRRVKNHIRRLQRPIQVKGACSTS